MTREYVIKEEAVKLFKEQSDATNLPFIFLSAGVSATLFQETASSWYDKIECYERIQHFS